MKPTRLKNSTLRVNSGKGIHRLNFASSFIFLLTFFLIWVQNVVASSFKHQVKLLPPQVLENDLITMKFLAGQKTGTASFDQRENHFGGTLKILIPDEEPLELSFSGFLDHVGTLDIEENRIEELFFTTQTAGSGSTNLTLYLIHPSKREILHLSIITFHDQSNPITEIERSHNFESAHLQQEIEFLEEIKKEFGWISEQDMESERENPDYAYYFWKKDNGQVNDGPMTIKKYSGKPRNENSINAELKTDGMVYRGYFKAGVIAYDESKDEHFVLFFPDNNYSWPTVIEKKDDYLLIGTRGEGVAVINLNTFHLKRFLPESAGNDIWNIRDTGTDFLINQHVIFDYPDF